MTHDFLARARSLLIPIAAIAALAACTAPPPVRIATPSHEVARVVVTSPVAAEREVRYFVDEQGMLWDDRGRNLGHRPVPSPAGKS
jgi:hypothetical protein